MNRIPVKVDSDLADIVFGFLDRRRQEIPTMWEALKSENYNYLEVIGHRLKGSSGGYGFDDLQYIGSEIETHAKLGDGLQIEKYLKQLEDYLLRVDVVFETQH